MLRLYLLAPAPTPAQRLLRFPLDEGIESINPGVVPRLLERIGRCGSVWRGPERRAEETAAALGLVGLPCDGLRAWSVGDWSGQSVARVAEDDPAGFRAWRTDPHAAPGGGESLTALMARVGAWTEALVPGAGRALVIADAAVLRAVIVHVLAAGPSTFWRFEIPPLSLSVVQHAHDEWRLRQLVLDPGRAADMKRAEARALARIADDAGRSVLLVNGVIQSVAPMDAERWGSYWAAMVPPFAPQRALVLGLGGATLPHLIVKRWGNGARLVGVDDDPQVLRLAGEAGWLRLSGLEPVLADAFAFVRTCSERFDYVAVDLYRGGSPPARMLARVFLRRLLALLDPPSWVCLNLYASAGSAHRLTGLLELFQLEHQLRVGENLILHVRPRALATPPQ